MLSLREQYDNDHHHHFHHHHHHHDHDQPVKEVLAQLKRVRCAQLLQTTVGDTVPVYHNDDEKDNNDDDNHDHDHDNHNDDDHDDYQDDTDHDDQHEMTTIPESSET